MHNLTKRSEKIGIIPKFVGKFRVPKRSFDDVVVDVYQKQFLKRGEKKNLRKLSTYYPRVEEKKFEKAPHT